MKLILFAAFITLLLALAWIDLKSRLLPDCLNFSLLWLGLLGNPWLAFTTLYAAIVGIVAAYLLLFTVYWGFKYVRKKEGLGFGDVKLLAALAAWFGWQAIPVLLFMGTTSTLLILLILKGIRRYPKDAHIPLGPGLCFAGFSFLIVKEWLC